jgi:[ribosomal protein S5]-alanine N-acetyltransferase
VTPSRFRLRLPDRTDASALAALMTPNVSRWVASWPSPCTTSFVEQRVEEALRAQAAGTALTFVIETAAGAVAGWVGFRRDAAHPRRASVGYWLGEAHQGQGLMSEILPAALQHAFAALDLDIVEAGLQPSNLGSQAVLKKCGMRYVGDRTVHAPARQRDELCAYFEVARKTQNSAIN